jgi:hypothetical protein
MLNYISRYTPPVQAQAPKVINSQRGGSNQESILSITSRMNLCRKLVQDYKRDSANQLDTSQIIERLRGEIELFQGASRAFVEILERDIGIRFSDIQIDIPL